jgi:hypothetical protein
MIALVTVIEYHAGPSAVRTDGARETTRLVFKADMTMYRGKYSKLNINN